MANSSQICPNLLSSSLAALERKRFRLTMGACSWGDGKSKCKCSSGTCTPYVGTPTEEAVCDRCSHPIQQHGSYPRPRSSGPGHLGGRISKALSIKAYITMRPDFVNELIARLDKFHLIRVTGTPASGKTTMMRLVANELLQRHPKSRLCSDRLEEGIRSECGRLGYLFEEQNWDLWR
ncbi:hypothetical protein BJX70DRAFT_52244 [Aspergillus crustosus]